MRSSTVWIGSQPCRRQFGWRRIYSVAIMPASSLAGLQPRINSAQHSLPLAPARSVPLSVITALRSGSPAPSASSPVFPSFLVASYSINMVLPLQRHPVRRARPSTPLRRLSRRDVPQRKAAGTAARSYRRNVLGRRWRHAARRPARTPRARLLQAQAEMAEATCLSSIP